MRSVTPKRFVRCISPDGSFVRKPDELAEAETVIGLADRWHKLPSEIKAEHSGPDGSAIEFTWLGKS